MRILLLACLLVMAWLVLQLEATGLNSKKESEKRRRRRRRGGGVDLWIDENQVKMFSGMPMEIFAIADGHVLPYILDPNFEKHLPIIPAEVDYVNFTWKSGGRKYFYHFDCLQSFNESILQHPRISVKTQGRIPRKAKVFTVELPCSGIMSGVAGFSIGLMIENKRKGPLPGTPLRLKLRKECAERAGPDPECDRKCANGGWCNAEKICQCREGYMGPYCMSALCYPQCMNGGTCTKPGVCSCPQGYQGRHCEGGICREKCLNKGKCIQKDTCSCPKGFYGNRCEFSKCIIPCLNRGRCKGVNKCRCPAGFRGTHCEVEPPQWVLKKRHLCSRPCRHGYCIGKEKCMCQEGWYGRRCRSRRQPSHKNLRGSGRRKQRRKMWL